MSKSQISHKIQGAKAWLKKSNDPRQEIYYHSIAEPLLLLPNRNF